VEKAAPSTGRKLPLAGRLVAPHVGGERRRGRAGGSQGDGRLPDERVTAERRGDGGGTVRRGEVARTGVPATVQSDRSTRWEARLPA